MQWLNLLIGGAVGLATSIGLIVLILQKNHRWGGNHRAIESHHTHQVTVTRLGGIALAGAMVAVVAVFSLIYGASFFRLNDRWAVVPLSLAMFGLGLWDDLFVLGAKRKLVGQIVIATIAYQCGIGIVHFRIPFLTEIIDLGWWAWPVTVFWLVAMTNLINLIDGVDGLAGGICLMLMSLLMYVSLQAGLMPVIAAGMVGALLGFLKFNFPPARIYMGDGGAYFLGFFIGCSTIVTSQKGTIFAALVAPLFVLALPIIDTSLAILRRGFRGLPLFRPDRKHIHHRLLASGHSRRNVVLGLYGFTAFFLLLGFAAFSFQGQFIPLLAGIGALTILLAAGKFDFSREWFSIGKVLGNSMENRAEVQYAMTLSRWLSLEGTRAATAETIALDAVFIARKLGFAHVRIRLEDEEKNWAVASVSLGQCESFCHKFPGHKYCFIEFYALCHGDKGEPTGDTTAKNKATFHITADLVAEGWVKAMRDWLKLQQTSLRFDASRNTPPISTANPHPQKI